jgi:hypothetical protein
MIVKCGVFVMIFIESIISMGGGISFIISKHPSKTPVHSHVVTCKVGALPGSWECNTGTGGTGRDGLWNWEI